MSDDSNTLESQFHSIAFNLLSSRRQSLIADEPNFRGEIALIDKNVKLEEVQNGVVQGNMQISKLIAVRTITENIFKNLEYFRSKSDIPSELIEILAEIRREGYLVLSINPERDGGENCDKDLYEARRFYDKAKASYKTYVSSILHSSTYQSPPDPVFERKLEKAKKDLKKLNTARVMIRNLTAAFALNPTDSENTRDANRKDLILQDFLKDS